MAEKSSKSTLNTCKQGRSISIIMPQISDKQLNLVDISILRKKPYLSFKKPNSYAIMIESKHHIINNTENKSYADWEMKLITLKEIKWEVIVLKEDELRKKENTMNYLEMKLAALFT